ncbi:hypothetical protein HKD37_18G050573 [Glycine soja]
MFGSFPKVWEPKTTTIQEARNLKTFSWDELWLSLMAQIKVELSTDDEDALMSRKRKDTRFKKKYKKEINETIFFECRKPRHMKLKRKTHSGDKKKKSLMVSWDDSDSEKSSNSDDEKANIYLMANIDKKLSHMIPLQSNKYKENTKYLFIPEESLSQISKIDESSAVEKLREIFLSYKILWEDYGKEHHLLSHTVSDKCDFCGKFRHSKLRCIHKKKQMSKDTNAHGPKNIWVPKPQIVLVADILRRKRPRFKLVLKHWMLMTHDGGKVYVPRPKSNVGSSGLGIIKKGGGLS